MSQTFMQRKRSRRTMGERILLHDTFIGSGALTSHTPDIFPTGASWSVLNGTFNTLDGGYARYTSGNMGNALIDCGSAEIELTCTLLTAHDSNTDYGITFRGDGVKNDIKMWFAGGVKPSLNVIAAANIYNAVAYIPSSWDILRPTADTYQTYRMSMFGNQYRLYIDGLLAQIYEDSGNYYLTNTRVGLCTYHGSTAPRWDTLTVRPLPEPVAYLNILGDSISVASSTWPYYFQAYHNAGCASISDNNATAGATAKALTANHFHDQAAQQIATGSNPDTILILIGTNDAIGQDFTAVYTDTLSDLVTGNSKAEIYCLGVLDRTGVTEAQRITKCGYIQAAVAANGARCHYIETGGWITPATDTSDGLHPTAAGHIKIARALLAVLP